MRCSPKSGILFLRNEMDASSQMEFEEHLESCVACRESLMVAAGGVELENEVRRRLHSSRELPSWNPDALEQLSRSGLSRTSSHYSDSVPDATLASELATLSPSDDPTSLGRIGLFEAKAILGRGGMGTVYKAIDPALGRTVAIKVLRPELASIGSARQRFRLEAKAMASIAHPHVVPIYAVDDHRGLPYLAMEYVPGGTLEARLQQHGPLEFLSILRIAQQIASALEAAHECGLVHRDIKPGNILLDRGVDRVRVTDFGLVRVSDDASMTRSGLIAGTPQYMAPEQVRGEPCDGRTDLFALGCVMYALLVGHPPFRADSPYAAMQRIVHDQPRPLRTFRADAPDWLVALVDRLLSKNPEHRFASASEVAHILESELVYLQNPAGGTAPERVWMQATIAPTDESLTVSSVLSNWAWARNPLAWLSIVLSLALLMGTIWGAQQGLFRKQSETKYASEKEDVKTSASSQTSPSSTPTVSSNAAIRSSNPLLWSRDGFSELQQQIEMESILPNQLDSTPNDPSWLEIQNLKSRFQQLDHELAEPDDW
ncbi:MAG: protein kinase [Planctomycetota bacterium]